MEGLPLWVSCGLVASLVYSLCLWINTHVPEMYMDELFHVRQTVLWCNTPSLDIHSMMSSWDPAITTLPGLYLASISFSKILPGFDCSKIEHLRMFSAIIAILTFPVLCGILAYQQEKKNVNLRVVLKAFEIFTLPVFFFFTPLFYTDIVSTFTVLVMYLLSQMKVPIIAGLVRLPILSILLNCVSRLVLLPFCADKRTSFGFSSLLQLMFWLILRIMWAEKSTEIYLSSSSLCSIIYGQF
jgi:hypothetical protein